MDCFESFCINQLLDPPTEGMGFAQEKGKPLG